MTSSKSGLTAVGTPGPVSVANSTLRYDGYGVRCRTGAVTLLRDRIIDNTQYGVHIANGRLVFGNDLSERATCTGVP